MNMPIRRRLIASFIPLFLVMFLIYLIPLVNTIISAFTAHAGRDVGAFVGIGNFIRIKDSIVRTVTVTLVWTIGSVVPAALFGMVLALLFQSSFRTKKLCMSVILLPYSIPLIIVASCWMFMYNQNFGLINVLLLRLGVIREPIKFLSFESALPAVIFVRVWRALPFAFINYYAAMTTIPIELYEAADVDGATAAKKLFFVTLPNLRTITSTTVIVLTVWTFLVFDIIYGMTGGGPLDATSIISIKIYRELFQMNDQGTASAWSLIAILVLLAVTLVYWNLLSKDRQDEGA